MKAVFDDEKLVFQCNEAKDNAMLFEDEYFQSGCEFANNCFLISIAPINLLVVK